MTEDNEKALREQLAHLRQQHRIFDEAIAALDEAVHRDQLQLSRLKRQKLKIKDQISAVEDRLLPDIIA